MPPDTLLFLPAQTDIVDTDPGGVPLSITGTGTFEKNLTTDWTGRAQLLRVGSGIETVLEAKPLSSLGQYGLDVKVKLPWSEWLSPEVRSALQRNHVVLELEGSGAVRFVKKKGRWQLEVPDATRFIDKNGQLLAQAAVAVKLNYKGFGSAKWTNIVVGLEFLQLRADLPMLINRVIPGILELGNLAAKGLQNRKPGEDLSPAFKTRFNDLATRVLPPILGEGGQISFVYPLNPLFEKIYGIGPLLKWVREHGGGGNFRIGATVSSRDPAPKIEVRNVDGNGTSDLYLVPLDPVRRKPTASHDAATMPYLDMRRVDFAEQFFGASSFDVRRSDAATALFVLGGNEYQAASLLPLPASLSGDAPSQLGRYGERDMVAEVKKRVGDSYGREYLPDPAVLKLADQAVLALNDLRSALPEAAAVLPSVLNSDAETSAALRRAMSLIHGQRPEDQALARRFVATLANAEGVDWGLPEVHQENQRLHGQVSPSASLQAALERSRRSALTVRPGSTPDAPEVITRRDGPPDRWALTQYRDNRNQYRFGLVKPGTSALEVKTSLDRWTSPRLEALGQAVRAADSLRSIPGVDWLAQGIAARGTARFAAERSRQALEAVLRRVSGSAATKEVITTALREGVTWEMIAGAMGGWDALAARLGGWASLIKEVGLKNLARAMGGWPELIKQSGGIVKLIRAAGGWTAVKDLAIDALWFGLMAEAGGKMSEVVNLLSTDIRNQSDAEAQETLELIDDLLRYPPTHWSNPNLALTAEEATESSRQAVEGLKQMREEIFRMHPENRPGNDR